MIIKSQVSVSSLFIKYPKGQEKPFLSHTFPRVLKVMAQQTRSSQRTSAEERGLARKRKAEARQKTLNLKSFTLAR